MDMYVAFAIMTFLPPTLFITGVAGHGRLIDPPSRASMWRFGFDVPQADYDDNQGYCGGQHQLWNRFGGTCGVCGDAWDPKPRAHERGGKFYIGTPTRTYVEGDAIEVTTDITANHRGWYEFRLCPYDNPAEEDIERDEWGNFVEVSHTCLDKHLLETEDGETRWYLEEPYKVGVYTVRLRLPYGVSCEKCLFQWKWNVANSWGRDPDGTSCVGCGKQEQFYACSDIIIRSRSGEDPYDPEPSIPPTEPPIWPTETPFGPPVFVTDPPVFTTEPPRHPFFPTHPPFFPTRPTLPPRPPFAPFPTFPPQTPVYPPLPFPTFFPLDPRDPHTSGSPTQKPPTPGPPRRHPVVVPTQKPKVPAKRPPVSTPKRPNSSVNFWQWLSKNRPQFRTTTESPIVTSTDGNSSLPWWLRYHHHRHPGASWWSIVNRQSEAQTTARTSITPSTTPPTTTTTTTTTTPRRHTTVNNRQTSEAFPWWIYFGREKEPFSHLPYWMGGDYKSVEPVGVAYSGISRSLPQSSSGSSGSGSNDKKPISAAAAGKRGPVANWGPDKRVTDNRATKEKPQERICTPVGVWTVKPAMWEWCSVNCAVGNCPKSHCICSDQHPI